MGSVNAREVLLDMDCYYLNTACTEKRRCYLVLHQSVYFPGNMHVSLAEALEVRGGPLQEEEIWAILNQSAESLQELFRKGKQFLRLINTELETSQLY